jgi:histidinol phosphatase-like enzyme
VRNLICLDVDDTIVEKWTTKLLPGVKEWLINCAEDVAIALISNQGGVGLRYWLEKSGKKVPDYLPTRLEVEERMIKIAMDMMSWKNVEMAIHFSMSFQDEKGVWGPIPNRLLHKIDHICPIYTSWNPAWRKPLPGMIEHARSLYPEADVIMVGDREEDYLSAANALVPFFWGDEFFGRSK